MLQDKKEETAKLVADIKVIPINMAVLSADIDKEMKKPESKSKIKIADNEFCTLRGSLGFVVGTNLVIDTDCVGELVTDKLSIEVYVDTKTDKGNTYSIIPTFSVSPPLDYLVKTYGLPEVSLKEFMGTQFTYNGRVCNNMVEIHKEYKKQIKNNH